MQIDMVRGNVLKAPDHSPDQPPTDGQMESFMSLLRTLLSAWLLSTAFAFADAPSGEIIGQIDLGVNIGNSPKLSADGNKAMLLSYVNSSLGTQNGIYNVATQEFTAIQQADSSGTLQRVKTLYDLSGDGSVVVGRGINDKPIVWTESTGVTELTGLLGESFHGYATNISEDGSIVFGWNTDTSSAFRWTATSGFTDPFDGLAPESGIVISNITNDGSEVIGINPTTKFAYLWSEPDGLLQITNVPTISTLLSGDGSTYAYTPQNTAQTFVFSDNANSTILGKLPYLISDDGSILAGMKHPNVFISGAPGFWGSSGYFAWTAGSGVSDVDPYFLNLGYDIPSQYQVGPIYGVSDDQKTYLVVGYSGSISYAIIHVPELDSLALFAIALPVLVVAARFVRRIRTSSHS